MRTQLSVGSAESGRAAVDPAVTGLARKRTLEDQSVMLDGFVTQTTGRRSIGLHA
jgi:hypothetical protein